MEIAVVLFVVIAIIVVANRFERRGNIAPRDEFELKNDTTCPIMSDRLARRVWMMMAATGIFA